MATKKQKTLPKAPDVLEQAAAEIRDRAALRDKEEEGERSMAKATQAWWLIYGDNVLARGYPTETEGWQFMSILKKVRGSQGDYNHDDYTDDTAYCALAAESAAKEAN